MKASYKPREKCFANLQVSTIEFKGFFQCAQGVTLGRKLWSPWRAGSERRVRTSKESTRHTLAPQTHAPVERRIEVRHLCESASIYHEANNLNARKMSIFLVFREPARIAHAHPDLVVGMYCAAAPGNVPISSTPSQACEGLE